MNMIFKKPASRMNNRVLFSSISKGPMQMVVVIVPTKQELNSMWI